MVILPLTKLKTPFMENKKNTKIIVDIAVIEELSEAIKWLLKVVGTKKLATDNDTENLKKVQESLSRANLLFQLSKPITDDKQ